MSREFKPQPSEFRNNNSFISFNLNNISAICSLIGSVGGEITKEIRFHVSWRLLLPTYIRGIDVWLEISF
jgi:hypothetical protein